MQREGILAAILLARTLGAAGTWVRFDPARPEIGPFPSDFLTLADPSQATGLRVNLPAVPDCRTQASGCQEAGLLNQLDGFSLRPRLRVRFSGPIDPDTVRRGVFLVRLDRNGPGSGVNQVVWDPSTNTAYAEPDQTLAEQARYGLVVTAAIRDRAGDPVEPDAAFGRCLAAAAGICRDIGQWVAGRPAPAPPRARAAASRVAAMSIFTTLSATAWLERARAALQNSAIGLERQSPRAVVDVNDILVLTLRLQEHAAPAGFSDITVPFPQALLAGVGRVAFASYSSPNFLGPDQTIAAAPSGAPVTLPAGTNPILFHAFLPSSPRPPGGYPVIVFGHGLNDSRFGAPTLVASTFARAGFATVAINAVGHGSGPESVLRLTLTNGTTFEVPAGGRSIDRNGDGQIESAEGCLIEAPAPIGLRDCLRQTALDLMQLVRTIRAGVDLDGDGLADLDGNRIYYAGQSLGGIYGTVLMGVEPGIRSAVLNVAGGSVMDIARWSPEFHGFPKDYLGSRSPPLLNRGDDYEEDYVLRNQPAKVNGVAGAIEIQNLFDQLEWMHMPGDPVAYAGRFRRPVLWQFARGDRTVPNPQTSALIRTAGNHDLVQLYRHDLARAVAGDLAANPHGYLVDVRSAASFSIAAAVQAQIAGFFAADGASVPGANSVPLRILFGRNLFETPEALPEDLGF